MILVISKYFGYKIGGAERSMEELLKSKGEEFCYIFFDNLCQFNAKDLVNENLKGYCIKFHWYFDFRVYPYTTALINYFIYKRRLRNLIRSYGITEVYAYGFFACGVAGFESIPISLFIRDEYGSGNLPNYHKGLKRMLYGIYLLTEIPGLFLWRKIISKTSFANVVYNSKFMQRSNRLKFITNSEFVIYPNIDFVALKRSYSIWKLKTRAFYITFIGDSEVKGIEIFKYLVSHEPKANFLHIGSMDIISKNVTNWGYSDIGKVMAHTRILLVPSQWKEAYGRVVREAAFLDIPTLASNAGGIPEAASRSVTLIDNFEDKDQWLYELRSLMLKVH